MNETELKKLIEDCCNDIFDRLEPLANVKSRLYQTLRLAINYTHCCKSDSEQLQAVEDLKDFARNNCREWNIEEMEEIIDRL